GLKPSDLIGPHGELAQTIRTHIVRYSNADLRSKNGPYSDLDVAFGNVLMDAVISETGKAFVLLHCEDFRLVRAGFTENEIGDRLEIHLKIPTFTFRKRAGEAPCPVPSVCIGSPVPPWRVPQSVQYFSVAMASHEFQNSGVIPASVQFLSKR